MTCPAGLNAQGFIALASQEKFAEAYTLIKEKIPLPGSLGRICYHPCETECNRKDIDEPVSICKIRRYIADYIYEKNQKKRKEILTKRSRSLELALLALLQPLIYPRGDIDQRSSRQRSTMEGCSTMVFLNIDCQRNILRWR